jgi:hypothetical protein
MDYLASLDALNRGQEHGEDGPVIFETVLRHMNDHDAEGQLRKVVLEFKASVDGDENVKLSLSVSRQLGVRQRAPLGFGNRQYFVIWKSLPDSRVNALV